MQASPDKAFEEWIKTHERVYSSDAERTTRHQVWLDNLAYIESHNKETESHWVRYHDGLPASYWNAHNLPR
jgi:hypothetical protein